MTYKMVLTPKDRESIIAEALTSELARGRISAGGRSYDYTVFPASAAKVSINNLRPILTAGLANVIYNKLVKRPEYRYISLGFYYTLLDKIGFQRDVRIVVKGSNAYAYLTDDPVNFPYSDLDVSIFINPALDGDTFKSLHTWLHGKVLLAMSCFKRTLDDMFFGNRKLEGFLKEDVIADFKRDYSDFHKDQGSLSSPFAGSQERNMCSNNSFLIKASLKQSGNVVKVDVPHYDNCETIPLRRTPFVCSYNETIDFKRDGKGFEGNFNLYRMKLHSVIIVPNSKKKVWTHVPADFIDVTLSSHPITVSGT